MDGINYIVCNSLETLIWLGNQLAIEFHVPFHSIHSSYVSEIVFDLDPPSPKEFSLAVQAAKDMKEIFDQLNLKTFVKFSGNKGLQVYIPLPETFTFAETGSFTELIARYLVSKKPEMFTIERLKKKEADACTSITFNIDKEKQSLHLIQPEETRKVLSLVLYTGKNSINSHQANARSIGYWNEWKQLYVHLPSFSKPKSINPLPKLSTHCLNWIKKTGLYKKDKPEIPIAD